MRHVDGLGELTNEEYNRLESRLEEYSLAWKRSEAVEIDGFLPPAGDPLRGVFLREFIKTDLEHHWQRGQPISLEVYLHRFPELTSEPQFLPQLLQEEYGVRQRYGDQPDLMTYRSRFPEHFQALEQLIKVGNTLAGSPPPAPTPPAAQPEVSPALSPMDTPGNTVLSVGGGYRLLKRIGSGGFGEVWRAEAPGGVPVAVKVIFRSLEDSQARQELDALQLIKQLQHLFLLQTHSFWPLQDRLIIVMDLADGNLRDRLKQCRAAGKDGIPHEELLGYFREAAEALDYLHENKVLHRDIKPDNILLLGKHARLADFGLARLGSAERSFTATGSGTPPYMAPEVWRNRYSPASDQYSLAASYAELRLDRRLFDATDMVSLMLQHLEHMPDLSPLPEQEQEVLRRGLAKQPEDRFATCLEFWEALAEAMPTVRRKAGRLLLPTRPGSDKSSAAEASRTPVGVDSGAVTPPPTPRKSALSGRPAVGKPNRNARTPATASSTSGAAYDPLSWRTTPPAPARIGRRIVGGLVAIVGVALLTALGAHVFRKLRPVDHPAVRDVDDGHRPPIMAPVVPPGFKTLDDQALAIGARSYYRKIAPTWSDGTEAEFLLIPPRVNAQGQAASSDEMGGYYIMRDKVSNRLYGLFAHDHPEQAGATWRPDKRASNFDSLPVFNVTALQADEFAKWLGGELPTAAQWDMAGGKYDGLIAPFANPADDIRVSEFALHADKKPATAKPVGSYERDTSKYGCRDMAANGREWTCTQPRDSENDLVKVVSFPPKNSHVALQLRGHTYKARQPYYFSDIDEAPCDTPWDDVGFRVVLKLPGPH